MSYSNVSHRSAVSIDATTPVKLFDSNTSTRIGWRTIIPAALTPGVGVLFYIQTAGATAPSKATIVAGPSLRAEAGMLVVDGARATLDIYAVLESGASISTIDAEELLQ